MGAHRGDEQRDAFFAARMALVVGRATVDLLITIESVAESRWHLEMP
jgi:hypothetical protein